jgi:hypothetical protein
MAQPDTERAEATLEQLRSDVRPALARVHDRPAASLFFEVRRVRDHMYAALDRKLWPRDQSEVYFLLGYVNSLMVIAADGLDNSATAEELARAGLAYALAIGHRPLGAYGRPIPKIKPTKYSCHVRLMGFMKRRRTRASGHGPAGRDTAYPLSRAVSSATAFSTSAPGFPVSYAPASCTMKVT